MAGFSGTEITIANMALARISVPRPLTDAGDGLIASCTDGNAEQRLCELWYPQVRDQLLEAFPWTFARGYVDLVLNDDGTGEEWEYEWNYAYTYPADCLKVRRFVNDLGSGLYGYWHEQPGRFGQMGSWTEAWRYVIRDHDGTRVILTDVESGDATIEYTKKITTTSLFTPLFASVCAWGLAAEVAMPLTESQSMYAFARSQYAQALMQAAASFSNEEHPRDSGDGEFVRSRGG